MKHINCLIITLIFISNSFAQKKNNESYNALINEIKSNKVEEVKNILEKNILDLNDESQDVSALHYACSIGNLEMVKLLLENKANPNIISKYGTPAFWAAEKGNMEVINMLLDYNYNPQISDIEYWFNISDKTKKPNIINKIIDYVKLKNLQYKNHPYTNFCDPADPLVLSASIHYAKDKKLKLTRRLIKKDININLVDKKGFTALILSIKEFNTEAVDLLVRNGADVNQTISNKKYFILTKEQLFYNNISPLHYLLRLIKQDNSLLTTKLNEILKIASKLKKSGANVLQRTLKEKKSVLDIAKEINNKRLLNILSSN